MLAHPDRSVLWRGGSRADDKPGQHLPVLLQQDLRLPVCVRPGERQQGCSRTSLRLCGEMFITQVSGQWFLSNSDRLQVYKYAITLMLTVNVIHFFPPKIYNSGLK